MTSEGVPFSLPITVIGGGLTGLVAAITCVEAGRPVRLLEAHRELGGRARSSNGPFVTNFGPHALYKGRANWRWLKDRNLLPEMARPKASSSRFYRDGVLRRTPPPSLLRCLPLLARTPPTERDFRSWAAERCGEVAAAMLCNWAGAFTFDPDPGRLSAAFVWERMRWIYAPPTVRYVRGGWSALVATLSARAFQSGVEVQTGKRVESLPPSPVIVATGLAEARQLLGAEDLSCEGPVAVLLDLGLEARRGDPSGVVDLDGGTLIERATAVDPGMAPTGEDLVQAHVGIASAAEAESGVGKIEAVLDAGFTGWRDRVTWRRRQIVEQETGALDLPGSSWHDRPAIDRGDGVFLAGDMVAAPGLLSEVSFESAKAAARLACAWREQY